MRLVAIPLLAFLAGCGLSGNPFRPDITDAQSILDLGELPVISDTIWSDPGFDPADPASGVVYTEVGADVDPAFIGGATFSFVGNGHNVCVVMDPENVFWNLELSGEASTYKYEDNYADDGDLDMDVGLTAYYNGSPGVEMGDFDATYTDPSGMEHTLPFNECFQAGYNGDSVHSGRGAVEACSITTDQRSGVSFTGAVKTFVLPVDDSKLGFAVGVFDVGNDECDQLKLPGRDAGVGECTFANEGYAGAEWEYSELEQAFCGGVAKLNSYCKDHLDDENAPCFVPSDAALGNQSEIEKK